MTPQTTNARPFLCWVEDVVRDSSLPGRPEYLTPEWRRRFALWYDAGETVAGGADMLRAWPWPQPDLCPTGPALRALVAKMAMGR